MFSVNKPAILHLCSRKPRAEKSHDAIVFDKLRFRKFFSSIPKRKPGVWKFLWFEEPRGTPIRRHEAAFSNFFGMVRAGSEFKDKVKLQ